MRWGAGDSREGADAPSPAGMGQAARAGGAQPPQGLFRARPGDGLGVWQCGVRAVWAVGWFGLGRVAW